MSREVNMIGMAIAKGLEERGQVGATHMGTAFDAWYPGYIDYAPNFKNIPAFWTETALFQYATPREYTIADFPENFRDLRPQSLYPSPWRPGWWRLGDAVAYMQTASLAVLDYASKYKESLLFNRYMAGRDQIARGATKAPFAYFVPQEQRDPVAAVELLRRLAFGGVRVSQLTAPATVAGETFPAGTWVVPTDQEFARDGAPGARRPELSRHAPVSRRSARCGRTTPPAGRCRCRWACASSRPRRRSTDDVRAKLKLLGPGAGSEGASRRRTTRLTSRTRRRSTACPASASTRIPTPRPSCRRPAASPASGAGARRSIRRRTTRFAPSTAPGRSRRDACSRGAGTPARAMSSAGCPRRRRPSWCKTLALVAERATGAGATR